MVFAFLGVWKCLEIFFGKLTGFRIKWMGFGWRFLIFWRFSLVNQKWFLLFCFFCRFVLLLVCACVLTVLTKKRDAKKLYRSKSVLVFGWIIARNNPKNVTRYFKPVWPSDIDSSTSWRVEGRFVEVCLRQLFWLRFCAARDRQSPLYSNER